MQTQVISIVPFQEGVPVSLRFAASQMDSVHCGGCIARRRDHSRVCQVSSDRVSILILGGIPKHIHATKTL